MSLSTLAAAMLATTSPLVATSPLATPVAIAPEDPVILTTSAGPTQVRADAPAPVRVEPVVAAPTVAGPTVADAGADAADGDIVVTGSLRDSPADPVAAVNAASFEATQAVDVAVVEPAARAYGSAIPVPIRHGLRNFLVNLHEPVIAANYLLQHKIGKMFETLGRFVLNSTLGLVGVFDVARRDPFNLPHRANGLGNTMGFYGIGPGPFLYLPLVGPTTVRDLIGGSIDGLSTSLMYGPPFSRPQFSIPTGALHQLEERIAGDAEIHRIRDETGDPYVAAREAYLRRRREEIDMLRCGRPDCAVAAEVAPAAAAVAVPEVSATGEATPVDTPVAIAPPQE